MSECEHYFHEVERLRQHRLDDDGKRELFAHLAGCGDCRELFGLQGDLAAAGNGYGEPVDDELAAMRGRVLDEIRRAAPVEGAPAEMVRGSGSRWFRPALAAAAVLLLVVTGFVGGRLGQRGAVAPTLLDSIETVALENRSLGDVEDSSNIFSGVRLREQQDGQVMLAFDVTRHVELVRPTDDPLVREVLVHALLNPSSLDARLKAIRFAGGAPEPMVRQALIFAMCNDESLPVRLRAMETLSEQPLDEPLESALLQVLLQDQSEQMRLVAIDLLATMKSSPEDFHRAVESSGALADPVVAARINQLTDL